MNTLSVGRTTLRSAPAIRSQAEQGLSTSRFMLVSIDPALAMHEDSLKERISFALNKEVFLLIPCPVRVGFAALWTNKLLTGVGRREGVSTPHPTVRKPNPSAVAPTWFTRFRSLLSHGQGGG